MTRASLLVLTIFLVMGIALAGYSYSLSQRVSELEGPATDRNAPAAPERNVVSSLEGRIVDLETRVGSLVAENERQDRLIRELRAGAGTVVAEAEGAEGLAPSSVEPPAGIIEEKVAEVLAKREEEERLERLNRMAQGMSRFLLNGIDVTEEQQEEFVKVMATFLDDREKVVRRAREVALEQATRERNDKLLRIFGQATYSQIEERLNRGARGFGGRGGPTRFGGRGR